MYDSGRGMAKDEREAVRWFRLAAEQGHAEAQSNLGASYALGQGVPWDEGEAVRWYRLAAEQGAPTAQVNLGPIPGTCPIPATQYRIALIPGTQV